tara:strand:+ start:330 stop:656 length:327 start_codon:yes stop_codon:yes gene_type:complete
MRKVEDKISIKDGDGFQQLDWRKKDTILEWAARYEIENDERLYQSLQEMKKRGGPALKTFWENIRKRTTAYNQIIDNEIEQRLLKIVRMIILYSVILNLLLLTYILNI